MTITNISAQLYDLATGHYINDVKFTSSTELMSVLKMWLHKEESSFIFQIALPDGKWMAKAIRKGSYFDYYIPDTREQEERLWKELLSK